MTILERVGDYGDFGEGGSLLRFWGGWGTTAILGAVWDYGDWGEGGGVQRSGGGGKD